MQQSLSRFQRTKGLQQYLRTQACYAGDAAGVTVNLGTGSATDGNSDTDTLSNFENITGSAYDDTLTGNSDDNVIEGGTGSDAIGGGSGTDTVSYQNAVFGVDVDLISG